MQNLNVLDILIIICTNSKFLYNYLIKLGTIIEKRLIINIILLREVYKKREITKIY